MQECGATTFFVWSLFCLALGLAAPKKDSAKGIWLMVSAICLLLSGLYFGISHFR
jgi:hypothetical protein